MKTLTLRPRYAYAILDGTKRLEFRSWRTSYRGPLLIHAGRPDGNILCVVDLIDILPDRQHGFRWVLTRPRRVQPVQMKGQMGLWNVPDEMIRPFRSRKR